MQAQRDVGRLGHGKIGVNNKRRIVAGLEKGRLKRSVAGFAKTNKVSFAKTSTAGFSETHYARFQTTLKEKWYVKQKKFSILFKFYKKQNKNRPMYKFSIQTV